MSRSPMISRVRTRTWHDKTYRIQRFANGASCLEYKQKANTQASRGDRSRRSWRWSMNLWIASSAPVTRRTGTDFQRWRQRRASTHVRTTSFDCRNDSTCHRSASGSAPMWSPPPPPSTAAFLLLGDIPSNTLRASGGQSKNETCGTRPQQS
ncbi:Os11g0201329, partial [Oryza sativa Japonica Group]